MEKSHLLLKLLHKHVQKRRMVNENKIIVPILELYVSVGRSDIKNRGHSQKQLSPNFE